MTCTVYKYIFLMVNLRLNACVTVHNSKVPTYAVKFDQTATSTLNIARANLYLFLFIDQLLIRLSRGISHRNNKTVTNRKLQIN